MTICINASVSFKVLSEAEINMVPTDLHTPSILNIVQV